VTTAGAGAVMFGAQGDFFFKMAVVMVSTVVVSFIYTFAFFAPWMLLVGPEGECGRISKCCCCCAKRNKKAKASEKEERVHAHELEQHHDEELTVEAVEARRSTEQLQISDDESDGGAMPAVARRPAGQSV